MTIQGFYSLADWYPKFHVTCITHSKKAVYPATIVGIPPQEDAWLAKATEKIFLSPVKMTLQPEIEDFHMPVAGIAHNLVIVKIRKNYPGQGMKVISSLFGAGQMMFTKYLVVVSGSIDIRDYKELLVHIFANIDLDKDLVFIRGPLDALDHSSDAFSFGGKVGIDATIKHIEENSDRNNIIQNNQPAIFNNISNFLDRKIIRNFNLNLFREDIPVLIITVNRIEDPDIFEKVKSMFRTNDPAGILNLIVAVDHTVDPNDLPMVAWQTLGNSDPLRDHHYLSPTSLFLDGTIKAYRKGGFPRKWPNIVCSDNETITTINQKWESLGIGPVLPSPSLKKYEIITQWE